VRWGGGLEIGRDQSYLLKNHDDIGPDFKNIVGENRTHLSTFRLITLREDYHIRLKVQIIYMCLLTIQWLLQFFRFQMKYLVF